MQALQARAPVSATLARLLTRFQACQSPSDRAVVARQPPGSDRSVPAVWGAAAAAHAALLNDGSTQKTELSLQTWKHTQTGMRCALAAVGLQLVGTPDKNVPLKELKVCAVRDGETTRPTLINVLLTGQYGFLTPRERAEDAFARLRSAPSRAPNDSFLAAFLAHVDPGRALEVATLDSWQRRVLPATHGVALAGATPTDAVWGGVRIHTSYGGPAGNYGGPAGDTHGALRCVALRGTRAPFLALPSFHPRLMRVTAVALGVTHRETWCSLRAGAPVLLVSFDGAPLTACRP